MNSNNNAVKKEKVDPLSDTKMLHPGGSVSQDKEQRMSTSIPVGPRPSGFNGVNLPANRFGDDVFGSSPAAVSVPLPSPSFAVEANTESPPLFHHTSPRPYQCPSRSLSMPASTRPVAFNQFNVRHHAQNPLMSYTNNYPGAPSLMPLAMQERYRPPNNNSSYVAPRLSVLHARCLSGTAPSYRSPGNMSSRQPFPSSILPGASSTNFNSTNHSSEKEQKEPTNTRKKRKACGHCEPCRRKENCGSCMNCINRAKGKQICIHRKCEVLKKKPGSSSSCSSLVQEKRKDTEGNLFATEAKRNKSVNGAPSTVSIQAAHFSEHNDQSQFQSQRFTERNSLSSIRPDLSPSTDSLAFLSASPSFDQFCSPSNDLITGSNPNISVPLEDPDFISQAFREIETSALKIERNPRNAFPVSANSEDASNLRSASLSHIHQLQPSIDGGATDCLWNSQFPVKFAPDTNFHLHRQSSVALPPGCVNSEQLQKSTQDLNDFNKFLPVASFSSTGQSQTSATFSSNFSEPKRLSQNEVAEHELTPSLNQSDIIQTDSFFAQSHFSNPPPNDNRGSVFDCDNHLLSSDMQMNSYNDSLVNQLVNPAQIPLSASENRNKTVPTPTSSHALMQVNNMMQNSQSELKARPTNSLPCNYNYVGANKPPVDNVFANTSLNPPHMMQNTQFTQFGLEHDERLLDSLNPNSFLNETFWNNSVRPPLSSPSFANVPSAPGPIATQVRPGVVVQNQPGAHNQQAYSARKISSNSSDCNFQLHRHLSAGSGSSNHSPLMQVSSGASTISMPHNALPADHNLISPLNGIHAASPLHSQVSGSPVPSMSQISPPLGVNPTNAEHRQSSEFAPAAASELPANGTWQDSMMMPTLSYHAHVAHSVAPVENFASKSHPTSSFNVNSAPHPFLAQPGSRLNSPTTTAPYRENTAKPNKSSSELSASPAAARLNESETELNNVRTGPALNDQNKVVAQQIFTETMNSILYGDKQSEKTPELNCSNSKIKGEPLVKLMSHSHSAESPSDVHPTISPGESGYDSTEPSSVTSENPSQYSLITLNSGDAGTFNGGEPKNAYAALMESKDRRAFNFEACQTAVSPLQTVLGDSTHRLSPVKAASNQASSLKGTSQINKILNNLPHDPNQVCSQNFTPPHQPTSSAKPCKSRSLSVDSGFPAKHSHKSDFSKSVKRTVPLRRYSHEKTNAVDSLNKKVILKSKSLSTLPPSVYHQSKNDSKQLVVEVSVDLCQNKPKKSSLKYTEFPNLAPVSSADISHLNFPANSLRSPTTPTSDDLRGRVGSHRNANGAIVKKTVFPQCDCFKDSDKDEDAPYYTHLGSARNLEGIRKLFESRLGWKGNALRIEKILYTGKEGKTTHGCPLAKWIIRRTNVEEKVLIVCRQRPGHHCATTYTVVVIMLWEGVESTLADEAYDKCTNYIPTNGLATERRCGTNEGRTCACQGFSDDAGGASFSFGCSWSMYYNGCKYARSVNPNKFKLQRSKDSNAESSVADLCQRLATLVSGVYKKAAPDAHRNQTEHEQAGFECRLGENTPDEGRPFSGVTCCMDFCAHSHKDQHNMDNGTTVVVTLTKPDNRVMGTKPYDEQFHVLPLYRWDPTDDNGRLVGIGEKIKSGGVEILNGFRREVRLRDKPLGTCKQRKEKKRRSEFEGFVSPPKRRKCQKIKRSRSMELVSVPDSSSYPNHQPHAKIKQETNPHHLNVSFNHGQSSSQENSALYPPPRWPYRRHFASAPNPVNHCLPSSNNLPSIENISQFNLNARSSSAGVRYPISSQTLSSPSPHRFDCYLHPTSPHQYHSQYNQQVPCVPSENSLSSSFRSNPASFNHPSVSQNASFSPHLLYNSQQSPFGSPHPPSVTQHLRFATPRPPCNTQYLPFGSPQLTSATRYSPSGSPHLPSATRYPSGSPQLTFVTRYSPSGSPHLPSATRYPSGSSHLPSPTQNPPLGSPHISSATRYPPSGSPHLPSATRYPPSGSPHLPSATRYPPSGSPHLPSATRYPPSGSPHLPSATRFPASGSPHLPTAHMNPAFISHRSNLQVKSEPNDNSAYYNNQSNSLPPVSLKKYTSSIPSNTVKQELVDFLPPPSQPASSEPPSHFVKREVFSDSEENFRDPEIGGVAIATCHGSVLIECAKRELHATTPLLKPNRFQPSRISLVFYQHKNMNYRNHGAAEYCVKEAKRNREKAEKLEREAAAKAESQKQDASFMLTNSFDSLRHPINPVEESHFLPHANPNIQSGLSNDSLQFHTMLNSSYDDQSFYENTSFNTSTNDRSTRPPYNNLECFHYTNDDNLHISNDDSRRTCNIPPAKSEHHSDSLSCFPISSSYFSSPYPSPSLETNHAPPESDLRTDNLQSFGVPLLASETSYSFGGNSHDLYAPPNGTIESNSTSVRRTSPAPPSFSTDNSTQLLRIG